MGFNERRGDHRPAALKQSLVVIALVIAGFMLQRQTGVEPATPRSSAAAVLLLLDNLGKDSKRNRRTCHAALSEAEWITLMFFLGLFVMVVSASRRRDSST
jgi:Na+/H+ antiporter NhaD/arsenite permease-like protein